MTAAEKHIRHYNHLNGNKIRTETLAEFHTALKKDIDSKKIDAHVPFGIECIQIEKRIAKVLKSITDKKIIVKCSPVALGQPKNLIITQTAQGPEVVSAKKKILHYHHEDVTLLYGLQCLKNDKHLDSKPLDGPNDTTYKVITDRILALLKEGGLVWRKPWNEKVNGPTDLAHNYVTKYMYRAGNYYLNFLNESLGGLEVIIDGKKKKVAYKHSIYFTFKQVTDLGGQINKGEKGWPVVYFKWLYKDLKANKLVNEEDAVDNKGKIKPGYSKFPGLFYYTVFNYDQCSGLKIKIDRAEKRTAKEKIESAEKIIDDMPDRPELKFGGAEAFYSPARDFVQMPKMSQFKVDQQYYSVFFHELIHSTGAAKRLDRDLTGKFGSKSYAFEELIAELGASFLCGQSGILYYTMKNSAAYIQSWTKALTKEMESDPKFFLRAASAAQRAADFILDVKEGQEVKVKATPSSKASRPPVERKATKKLKKKKSLTGRKSKAVPSVAAGSSAQSVKKATLPDKPSNKAGLGFITSDKAPETPPDTFTLPGPIGSLLGRLQRYKLEIVISGETHSSKSELGKQIGDAFCSAGDEVAWLDWEQGGLASKDTLDSINRNVQQANKKKFHVSHEVPRNLEALKKLTKHFKVIAIDSGTKLNQVTNAWIDELREDHPDTVWIIMMQQNEKGGTRGGAAAEFDSPVVLKTYRPDHQDPRKNYAYVFKNRGNKTGLYYIIADKRVTTEDPTKQTQTQPVQ